MVDLFTAIRRKVIVYRNVPRVYRPSKGFDHIHITHFSILICGYWFQICTAVSRADSLPEKEAALHHGAVFYQMSKGRDTGRYKGRDTGMDEGRD